MLRTPSSTETKLKGWFIYLYTDQDKIINFTWENPAKILVNELANCRTVVSKKAITRALNSSEFSTAAEETPSAKLRSAKETGSMSFGQMRQS